MSQRLGRTLREVALLLCETIHLSGVGTVERQEGVARRGELCAGERILARGAVEAAAVGEVVHLLLPVAGPQVPCGKRVPPLELEPEGPGALVLLAIEELEIGEADAQRGSGRERASNPGGSGWPPQASRHADGDQADPQQDDDEVRDPQRGAVWTEAGVAGGHARDSGTRHGQRPIVREPAGHSAPGVFGRASPGRSARPPRPASWSKQAQPSSDCLATLGELVNDRAAASSSLAYGPSACSLRACNGRRGLLAPRGSSRDGYGSLVSTTRGDDFQERAVAARND